MPGRLQKKHFTQSAQDAAASSVALVKRLPPRPLCAIFTERRQGRKECASGRFWSLAVCSGVAQLRFQCGADLV